MEFALRTLRRVRLAARRLKYPGRHALCSRLAVGTRYGDHMSVGENMLSQPRRA